MKNTMVFAKRNFIEVGRDPLSWIFCIAFPIVMLVIMSIVNSAIPKEGMIRINIKMCFLLSIFKASCNYDRYSKER